jgi:hypothetical protein
MIWTPQLRDNYLNWRLKNGKTKAVFEGIQAGYNQSDTGSGIYEGRSNTKFAKAMVSDRLYLHLS